ncbi:hypothetical protein [Terracidiphilus sp.]|jgi:hypothetical protein|uniref:hypothetical protein n=1 Tax=Terracidiphilus sp. TaxID=1964191 RepID=UPI003C24567A
MTGDKRAAAKTLATAHLQVEPGIRRIVHVVGDEENASHEPVKLLEVNPDTPPSGIVPIAFAPDPPRFPFSSVVIEVTEAEFEKIRTGKLQLPNGWRLEETLYPQGNAA